MTRYRKKPEEVDAWQVGSDEPMPEWACEYLNYNPHIQERYSHLRLWLVRAGRRILLCTRYQFEQTYEVIE